jgi:hypothetical protein
VGELREGRWSVVSERGREAGGLSYAEAAALVRRLLGEKVYGTCVVTDEAAARLAVERQAGAPHGNNGAQPAAGGNSAPAKKRRVPRRKRTDAEN